MRFYEDGVAPTKNLTAMQDAMQTAADEAGAAAPAEDADAAPADASGKKKKVRQRP